MSTKKEIRRVFQRRMADNINALRVMPKEKRDFNKQWALGFAAGMEFAELITGEEYDSYRYVILGL